MTRRRTTVDPHAAAFAKADLKRYEGQYVAILRDQVLAHGKDAVKVYAEARTVLSQQVPPEEIHLAQVRAPGIWIV